MKRYEIDFEGWSENAVDEMELAGAITKALKEIGVDSAGFIDVIDEPNEALVNAVEIYRSNIDNGVRIFSYIVVALIIGFIAGLIL